MSIAQALDAAATPEPSGARIAFFHQNDPFSRQGGVERYLATLLSCASGRAALVSPPLQTPHARQLAVRPRGPTGAPQWLRYLLGLYAQHREIRAFLREESVGVLELSRPEYILACSLLPGVKVVTIHGTGPNPRQLVHYALHHLCCLLLPFLAAQVQIVGRDRSGLPRLAQWILGSRIAHVDAWRDDVFKSSALPPLCDDAPLRVFYAGRIAPQKDPALLFKIIRAAAAHPGAFDFSYFGSDYEKFREAGLEGLVRDGGFLGAGALAEALGACHVGLLCSAFGEGSPFILIETLGCGRPFVLPPLPTLVEAYGGVDGAHIVRRREVEAFVDALLQIRADMLAGRVDPFAIADGVADRAQSRAAPRLLAELARLSTVVAPC